MYCTRSCGTAGFHVGVCVRYGKTPLYLPTKCDNCCAENNLHHALVCSHGGSGTALHHRRRLSATSSRVHSTRREWLRTHPEDATDKEKLAFAQGEIAQLLRLQSATKGSTADLRGQLAHAGLPLEHLLNVADVERAAVSEQGCAGHGKLVRPVGQQFHSVRNDGVPLASNASMALHFRVVHCRVGDEQRFEITRLVGCRAPRDVAGSAETLSRFVRRFGPDEIEVMLEGAELLPCNVSHRGACRYLARCGIVRRGGAYHLLAMHLRSNYDALDEKRSDWPPLQWDQLVGEGAVLELPSVANRPQRDAEPTDVCDEACGRHVASGRWVDARATPPSVQPVGTLTRVGERVRRLWVTPSRYEWQPTDCAMRDWTLPLLTGCLRSASVRALRVVGDSHASTLFGQLISALKWDADPRTLKAPARGDSLFERTATVASDGVVAFKDYNEHLYHRSPDAFGAGNGTAVLVNFGQHEAAARMPLELFEAKVRAWAADAVRWRAAGAHRHVFWLTGVIGIPRTDGYVRGHGDGRTIHRSILFNDAASRIAVDATIPLIDNTAPIRAFPLLTKDSAHYTDPVFRLHMPNVVLGQLGASLCPHHLAQQTGAGVGGGTGSRRANASRCREKGMGMRNRQKREAKGERVQ